MIDPAKMRVMTATFYYIKSKVFNRRVAHDLANLELRDGSSRISYFLWKNNRSSVDVLQSVSHARGQVVNDAT